MSPVSAYIGPNSASLPALDSQEGEVTVPASLPVVNLLARVPRHQPQRYSRKTATGQHATVSLPVAACSTANHGGPCIVVWKDGLCVSS